MTIVDKFTYLTIELALFSSYTMGFGNVESETGYTKEQLAEIDKKYVDKNDYKIDEVDLAILIKAMEWMLVVRDESELLDITNEQGLKLLRLLKQSKSQIKMEDWFSQPRKLPNKEYSGDTKKGNVFINTDMGSPTIFPNSDPAGFIRKSSSKDLFLRNGEDKNQGK